jgi:hypothetical protein
LEEDADALLRYLLCLAGGHFRGLFSRFWVVG